MVFNLLFEYLVLGCKLLYFIAFKYNWRGKLLSVSKLIMMKTRYAMKLIKGFFSLIKFLISFYPAKDNVLVSFKSIHVQGNFN